MIEKCSDDDVRTRIPAASLEQDMFESSLLGQVLEASFVIAAYNLLSTQAHHSLKHSTTASLCWGDILISM